VHRCCCCFCKEASAEGVQLHTSSFMHEDSRSVQVSCLLVLELARLACFLRLDFDPCMVFVFIRGPGQQARGAHHYWAVCPQRWHSTTRRELQQGVAL